MKLSSAVSAVLIVFLSLIAFSEATTPNYETGDKTLSPYFFIRDGDEAESLPLKSTDVSVDISGVIADVKVKQVYRNEGKTPIEAIYVFPASTRAAVYGMKMSIGERVIEAKIKKRDEARQEYEEAKQQGKGASLLEQHRPNVFQMNVANIMPGDEIRVELKYTEMIVPEDRVYEFVYPTVVGPRYSNSPIENETVRDKWVRNPYLHQGELPDYTFGITINISAGLPVNEIHSPSHKVNVGYDGPASASVRLDRTEIRGGNRDFVLNYRLAGKKIESGLMLSKGEKENFFMLMVQPPKRITPEQIPGREYIFIVDVSGSMHGFPLEISKKLLRDLIGKLRPSDSFNVLLFAGVSSLLSERSLPATTENIRTAMDFINRQQGGGGTELLPSLKRALALPRVGKDSRTVIIATDGYVTVEEEAFDLIRRNLGKANMFTFGIGTSVNRHLIEGMARAGMGEAFVITKPDEAEEKAEAFRKMISSPVLTDIKVDFGGFDVYDVEPISIPDLMADRPVIVFGKWRGAQEGRITVKGLSGDREFSDVMDTKKVKSSLNNSSLRYLWARHRIATLSDYNALRQDDRRIKEITTLGLNYNLLTAYTSFVATDSEVRNKDGRQTTVNQPLPLPEGVSDYAVGSAAKLYRTAPGSPPMRTEMKSADLRQKEFDQLTPEPDIKISALKVSGGDGRRIEKQIKDYLKKMPACYSRGRGTVTLTFSVTGEGAVKDLNISKDTTADSKGTACLINEIRKWKFGKIKDKEKSTVTVSFDIG